MISQISQFVNNLNKPKYYLMLGNILLVFFAILLTSLVILPFKRMGDFVFFAGIGLILALYRPGWGFLFFIGTIALENINVAPADFPIAIRPYQFFGAVTILAMIIRLFSKRLGFKLVKLQMFDWLLVIFAAASFASSFFSADKIPSIKQSLVLVSFIFLYYLVRNYIQKFDDLKKILPFFLSSSAIVVIYGIWQNIRFLHNLNSFEVMLGRPNATFTEPDWLGIFLVFMIAVIYSLISSCHSERPRLGGGVEESNKNLIRSLSRQGGIGMTFLYVFLFFIYILLILTVSRSAWLGAAAVAIIFLKIILTRASWHINDWRWKDFWKQLGLIISTGIISLIFIYIFHLTNFQLFNRAQSSASGLQKITISCTPNDCINKDCIDQKMINPGSIINDISELKNYNCGHINLEDIEKEKAMGNYVTEVYHPDPNVNIRGQIYQKSWQEIKNHPIFGIGWGSIGKVLGTDERGASLNSSNIFLEVWLGSGILGLLTFAAFIAYILFRSILIIISKKEFKSAVLFAILGSMALIIPNLFNAGIFLGVLWLYFGTVMFQFTEKK
jgi:hypothetical protein